MKCLHTSGLGAQGTVGAEKAFAGWQQQKQRHSAASLQRVGQTRLNPAGSGMCSETHWPGIWDVRLTLLNDSLATMSIRATPSSLFDIKAKESGAGWMKRGREEQRGYREEKMEKEEILHSSSINHPNIWENVCVESVWQGQTEQGTWLKLLWLLSGSNRPHYRTVVLPRSFHCECVQVYHCKAWWCLKTALRSAYFFLN